MAFIQVTNLLGKTAGYHRRALRKYAGSSRHAGTTPSACLAEFLSREEADMLRELDEIGVKHRDVLGKAWIQFEPDEEVETELGELEATPPYDVEALAFRGLDFEGRLCGYMRRAAQMAPTADIQELFEGVERSECSRRKRLSAYLAEALL